MKKTEASHASELIDATIAPGRLARRDAVAHLAP
jgi:hypothetical protein